ncbi:glycosyltransferase family 4 protein [Pontibacter beigongshangensis]|uniref:glycosyltransferase family 4 protein n=1 Tax=Pontibacter beigongshangensis TaxID=2574733 RepID=UPI00164FD2D3|nr:glycosyltransferase family 1 protein [Pontibacter beigongshangensis]
MNSLCINARFLTQPVTGVQRFGIELSRQIKKLLPETVFVAPPHILHKEVAAELGVVTFGKMNGHLWEQFELPLFLKKQGNPLLLNLANTAPLLYPNKVVTIHDLAFKVNPGWFSKPFYLYYNFLIPHIARNSLKIITVTQHMKADITQILNVPATKVEVIYNAVSFSSAPANSKSEKNDLPARYVLAVSSLDPRKNFVRLLKAFGAIQDKEVKLLIIGGSSKVFADQELQRLLKETPQAQAIGYVPDEELHRLYRHATAFIYPSLYEGFGIPNIEAMALGCPVITSAIGPIEEVCGKAALFVDPYQETDITARLNQLLASQPLQEELRAKGLEQAGRYSWRQSARQLLDILQQLPA